MNGLSLKITRTGQISECCDRLMYLLTLNRAYIYHKIQHKETITKSFRYKYQGTTLQCINILCNKTTVSNFTKEKPEMK